MEELAIIIFLILIILIYIIIKNKKSNCSCGCLNHEHFIAPGYSNRHDVRVNIDKTYGGNDSEFKNDPRFSN